MLTSQTSEKLSPASRALAVFCALAVWMLSLLVASPQLHAALHADADQIDHSCAVTLFSHGCDDGVGAICLACAPALFVVCENATGPVLAAAEVPHRQPPGRGPPLS